MTRSGFDQRCQPGDALIGDLRRRSGDADGGDHAILGVEDGCPNAAKADFPFLVFEGVSQFANLSEFTGQPPGEEMVFLLCLSMGRVSRQRMCVTATGD